MNRRIRKPGFTLLELILVLAIIGITLSLASPSVRGWGRGSTLRNVSDDFLAMTRLARTQAVATARVHRLTVNNGGYYEVTVQQGEQFVPISSTLGQPQYLPQEIGIQVIKQTKGEPDSITFYPNGRTEVARVRITSSMAGFVEMECLSPAEQFQITNSGDQ